MQRGARLSAMLEVIVTDGSVDVTALSERFAVSLATVRRDLATLESQRLVSRSRGRAATHAAFNDLPLSYKTAHDLAEKRRIAARAVELLGGAKVIGLTGGTTVLEFAKLLAAREGITVVTNALNVATVLLGPRLRVLAAGGEIRSSSQEAVGPSAEEFVAGYNLDVAVLGVDGVDAASGCTNYDHVGARVNALLLERARRVLVLADASKIGRVALAQVCPMSAVDVLVTDTRIPPSAAEGIRAAGCEVALA